MPVERAPCRPDAPVTIRPRRRIRRLGHFDPCTDRAAARVTAPALESPVPRLASGPGSPGRGPRQAGSAAVHARRGRLLLCWTTCISRDRRIRAGRIRRKTRYNHGFTSCPDGRRAGRPVCAGRRAGLFAAAATGTDPSEGGKVNGVCMLSQSQLIGQSKAGEAANERMQQLAQQAGREISTKRDRFQQEGADLPPAAADHAAAAARGQAEEAAGRGAEHPERGQPVEQRLRLTRARAWAASCRRPSRWWWPPTRATAAAC